MTTIDEVVPVIKAAYKVMPAERYVMPTLSDTPLLDRNVA